MNVHCYGYRGLTGQINRVEEGFNDLGITTLYSLLPDLIYANDIGSWDNATSSQNWPCKVILNLLDLPVHLPIDCAKQIRKVKRFAEEGYTITCISKFVQGQLKEYCGVDAPIIYQPAKNIRNLGLDRDIKYLIVGRNNDPQKGHSDITLTVVNTIDGNFDNLHVVGENIGVGNYHRNVDDIKLEELYNRAQYVFCPSLFEGLGMPMIEAILAGSTPISYRWHPTAREFIEKELVFNSVNAIIDFIKGGKTHRKELYTHYPIKFSGKAIAKNILNVEKTSN